MISLTDPWRSDLLETQQQIAPRLQVDILSPILGDRTYWKHGSANPGAKIMNISHRSLAIGLIGNVNWDSLRGERFNSHRSLAIGLIGNSALLIPTSSKKTTKALTDPWRSVIFFTSRNPHFCTSCLIDVSKPNSSGLLCWQSIEHQSLAAIARPAKSRTKTRIIYRSTKWV